MWEGRPKAITGSAEGHAARRRNAQLRSGTCPSVVPKRATPPTPPTPLLSLSCTGTHRGTGAWWCGVDGFPIKSDSLENENALGLFRSIHTQRFSPPTPKPTPPLTHPHHAHRVKERKKEAMAQQLLDQVFGFVEYVAPENYTTRYHTVRGKEFHQVRGCLSCLMCGGVGGWVGRWRAGLAALSECPERERAVPWVGGWGPGGVGDWTRAHPPPPPPASNRSISLIHPPGASRSPNPPTHPPTQPPRLSSPPPLASLSIEKAQ